MGVYIGLLLGMFLIRIFFDSSLWGKNRSRKYFLFFSFVLIFLIFALRSYTVGRDVPGYRRAYLDVINHPFLDFDYVYYEKGYQLLTKICRFTGVSWQVFLSLVSALIIIPIYVFIKKYSKNVFLSTLIFVCYMLFEFDLTALRQAIAISISLFAFMVLVEKSKWYILKFILIVILAATFHKSALLCLALLPLVSINDLKKYTMVLTGLGVFSLIARNWMLQYIKVLFSKDTMNAEATMYIGGNIIFLFALALFMLYIQFHEIWRDRAITDNIDSTITTQNTLDFYLNKIFMFSIVIALIFGSDTSARSFMYFMQVIVVLLPNMIYKLETKSRMLVSVVFIVFFCVFFYWNSLSGGGFDIVPYHFFWQYSI